MPNTANQQEFRTWESVANFYDSTTSLARTRLNSTPAGEKERPGLSGSCAMGKLNRQPFSVQNPISAQVVCRYKSLKAKQILFRRGAWREVSAAETP
jgi:hypothetical protein